jgi:enamine deaminase RidA (YjgF/YER057c/UK114 family)
MKVLQPPGWAPPQGYANGVAARGTLVVVGGQVGRNVVDRDEYAAHLRSLGAAYREAMARHLPAMSAVEVSRLVEPRARVEIEATAVVPDA